MSSGAKSSASPYEVTVGGTTFKGPKADGLLNLVVEDHMELANHATIRLGGAEEQPSWNFKIGDEVEVKMGDGADAVFKGEVTSLEPGFQVEGQSSMTLRCLDKSHRLGRGRETNFWNDKKDSDVAQEVGAKCGLSVDADDTETTLPYILQRNESNLAFLKRLAARNNFVLRAEGDKLLFKKASFEGQSESIKMGDNLRSMRMSFNTSDMVQKVVVRGWDISKKCEIVGQCSAGEVTKIGSGEIGAEMASKFGDSTAYITDVPVSSQEMADAVAKSEMERLARQFCHGSCSISGKDTVRAGGMVEFEGLSEGCNGKFAVMATRHTISNRSGYTTEITFCSNTMGS